MEVTGLVLAMETRDSSHTRQQATGNKPTSNKQQATSKDRK